MALSPRLPPVPNRKTSVQRLANTFKGGQHPVQIVVAGVDQRVAPAWIQSHPSTPRDQAARIAAQTSDDAFFPLRRGHSESKSDRSASSLDFRDFSPPGPSLPEVF